MGWNTLWVGKNHNVPDYRSSQTGPFDLWYNGLGFEHFYGEWAHLSDRPVSCSDPLRFSRLEGNLHALFIHLKPPCLSWAAGFVGGDTNQWRPSMYEGVKPIEPYAGESEPGVSYSRGTGPQRIIRGFSIQTLLPVTTSVLSLLDGEPDPLFLVPPVLGKPDYILNTDLANYTISYMERQKALAPDKPFFIYYAPGA